MTHSNLKFSHKESFFKLLNSEILFNNIIKQKYIFLNINPDKAEYKIDSKPAVLILHNCIFKLFNLHTLNEKLLKNQNRNMKK